MPDQKLTMWQRKANRERRARLAAETLLERQTQELYASQRRLAASNSELEQRVAERTTELLVAKERAEAASVAKGQFLASLSHEIRTPLNGAIGTLELLRETALDTTQHELADAIAVCTDTLLDLINAVLDTAKIEAGHVALVSEACDLGQIVRDATTLFRAKAASRGVALTFSKGGTASPCVLADPMRVRQVVHNLIGNAVKFTPQGSIDVRLATEPMEGGRVAVTVQIADTGVGIAAAELDRVFDEFHQIDSVQLRQHGGTGLGLSISRRLARLMGGELSVASEPGQGAVFSLALLALQSECPVGLVHAANHDARLAGLRVLVVDGNIQNRMVAGRMLANERCVVAEAASGEQALGMLASADFDLVLLDGQMPGMDGDQVARRIRDPLSPVRDHGIPILGLTADVLAERLEQYMAAGMDALLTKPYRKAQLLAAVIDVLALSPAAAASAPAFPGSKPAGS